MKKRYYTIPETMTREIFADAIKRLENLTDKEWEDIKEKYTKDNSDYSVPDEIELIYPSVSENDDKEKQASESSSELKRRDPYLWMRLGL